MRLGFSTAPTTDARGTERLARAVEEAGLASMWLYDVPRECPDPYLMLSHVAAATSRLRFGPLVSNPVTREPALLAELAASLQAASGGRMELGLGRGDAGVYRVGRRPSTVEGLRQAIARIREGVASADPSWASPVPVPIWIGTTCGPRVLRLAGEVADGVILQVTDAELISWSRGFLQSALPRGDGGRVRVMVATAAAIDRRPEQAVADVRWFSRMVARDLAPLIVSHGAALSPWWRQWAEEWTRTGDAARDPLADRATPRLALVGGLDDARARLAELESLGVDETVVFSTGDPMQKVESLKRLLNQ